MAVVGTDEVFNATIDEENTALDDAFGCLSWERFLGTDDHDGGSASAANLARMAESLVGLQVLRQMTQAGAETVGGPSTWP